MLYEQIICIYTTSVNEFEDDIRLDQISLTEDFSWSKQSQFNLPTNSLSPK